MLLLMLLNALELIKFVPDNIPIVWFVPLSYWRCSRTDIDLNLNDTYHYIHSNRIYLKQTYNVINNLFIKRNTLHTKCKQLFRWDPTPSTCSTLTKAEDMGLPTSSVRITVPRRETIGEKSTNRPPLPGNEKELSGEVRCFTNARCTRVPVAPLDKPNFWGFRISAFFRRKCLEEHSDIGL